ncbi:hypothetical protein GGF32_004940, partial [Allomyces javanicus]
AVHEDLHHRYRVHPITLRFLDSAVEDEYRKATAMLNLIRNEGIAWMVAVASIAHTAAYEMTLYPALIWTWAVRRMVPITLIWLAFCFLFYFWVGDTAAALVNFARGVANARANGQIAPNDPVTDAATVAPFVPNTGPVSAYAILFFGANVCIKGPRHFQKGALTLVVVVVHVVINVLVVPLAVERGQLTAFSCYLASSLASTWSSFKIEYVWRHLFAETRRDQIEAEWSCSDLGKMNGFGSAMAAAAFVHDVRATGLVVPDQPALTVSRTRMTRARRHAQPTAVTNAREALSHTWLYRLLCRFPGRDEAMYQRQRSVPLRLEARYNIVLATVGVVAEMVLDWEHSRAMLVEPGYQIEVVAGWTMPCLWVRIVWTVVVQVVDLVIPYLPLVKWNGTRLLLFNTATFVAFVLQYVFAMWIECLNHNPVLSAVQTTNLIRQLLFFAVESGVTTQYYLLGTSAIAILVLLGGLFGPDPVRGPFMSTFMRTLIAQAAGAFVARDVEHMMRQFYLGNNLFAVPASSAAAVDEGQAADAGEGGKLRVIRGGGVRSVARSAPVLPSPTVMVVGEGERRTGGGGGSPGG